MFILEYKISVHFHWQYCIQTEQATAQNTNSERVTVSSQSTTRKEVEKKNKQVALDVALAAEKTNQKDWFVVFQYCLAKHILLDVTNPILSLFHMLTFRSNKNAGRT